jgi:hypothetical protein
MGGAKSIPDAIRWLHEACPPGAEVHHDCEACRLLHDLCAQGQRRACTTSAAKCRCGKVVSNRIVGGRTGMKSTL